MARTNLSLTGISVTFRARLETNRPTWFYRAFRQSALPSVTEMPRDFGTGTWLFEELSDTRPTNPNRPPYQPPLALAGNGVVPILNGSVTNEGPFFSNFPFPYVMLDTRRSLLLLHPTTEKATSVGVRVAQAGRYRVSGAFARGNNFRWAGDGVDVAIVRNLDMTNPLFRANISSDHEVNADAPFTGSGAATLDFEVELTAGEPLRSAVFNGSQGQDISFGVTALQFSMVRLP